MNIKRATIFHPVSLSLIASSVLYGCGSNNSPNVSEGLFIDAAVEGLHYTSGNTSGVTDADGKFSYEEGQNIKFYVDGLFLGEVSGSDIITPLTFQTVEESKVGNVAINIARLLQTLDVDLNPENGIQIPEETGQDLSNLTIDFTLSTEEFAANDDVLQAIVQITGMTSLVEQNTAVAHLIESLTNIGIEVTVADNVDSEEDSDPDNGDNSDSDSDGSDDGDAGSDDGSDDGDAGSDDG
ncbi:hypothetical protein FJ444_20980, partial [Aestuariibacter sp. GS-14]